MSDNATQWIRLTPDGEIRGNSSFAQYRRRDDDYQYPHHIEAGCNEMMLTNAEALAFTIATGNWRDVPEVRALGTQLQAVMWTLENMLNQFGARWPMKSINACRTSLELGQAALHPFETASDEGDTDHMEESNAT